MAEGKTCGVDGCTDLVAGEPGSGNEILCAAHWKALPEEYRADVQRCYDERRASSHGRWRKLKHGRYVTACSNAIRAAGRKPEDAADQPA